MEKRIYKTVFLCKSAVLLFLIFFSSEFAFSQSTGTIKGNVSDATDPLPGASITVTGTSYGAKTDADGNYSISLPPGTYTLVVSYIGYTKQEQSNLRVTAGSVLNQSFKLSGNTQLEEVVVSYGKQVRREITGSVSNVDAKQLEDMPVIQFTQQLQGKVAGVDIAATSGQPGRGIAVRIRGAASFTTDYQPLYVVDGMPVTGSINNINPDEIESFSILKDAAASALYGSRAANGVVLITTKKAKNGDNNIEFAANYGLQKIAEKRVPKTMNGTEWATFMQQRFEDKVKYEGFNAASIPAEYQGDPNRYGEGTDWFHLMTQTAPIQSYSLSLFSGREKSSSAVVASYQAQEGTLINTGTKLFSLRLNQDINLMNNKLKVGFNLAPTYRLDHNNRVNSDGVGGYYERIFESSPIVSPYQANGDYTIGVSSPGMVAYINPLAILKETTDDYITTRILGNGYANYEIIPGLIAKLNAGIDKGAETKRQFSPSVALSNNAASPAQSTGSGSSVDNYSYTAEGFLEYEKRFLTNHHVQALVGYSIQRFNSESVSASGSQFNSDDIPYLSQATVTAGGNSMTQYSLLSELGRLNYDYKGKYLLQASLRRDGSSRFGREKQYGYFPAVSAGWIMSDEKFMSNLKFIDFLKLRGSYGITGNNSFGNFTALSTISRYYYALSGVAVQAQTIGGLGNSVLAWERNKQLDLGFEAEFLKNRISLTYSYYNKLSDGLLMPRPLPRASGFSTIQYNIGQLKFWGHEITVGSTNLTGKLKWNTDFNISFERNVIKNLVSPGFLRRNNTVSSDYFRNQIGHRLGEFYGFVYLGLYQDAADLANSAKYVSGSNKSDVGTLKMKDLNGDGIVDDVNDRTFIGDPTPDFNFGLTNTFNYKNFDLSITMAGSVGGEILAASKWAYLTNMDGSRVPLAAALDHWRSPENPGSGIYPRTLVNTTAIGRSVNSQWVEDGSYLTAKNIALGYNFNLKNNKTFQNFKVYASVQQAFIITGYSGYSPEITLNGLDAAAGIGVDENAYPVPRTFSLGIRTTFK